MRPAWWQFASYFLRCWTRGPFVTRNRLHMCSNKSVARVCVRCSIAAFGQSSSWSIDGLPIFIVGWVFSWLGKTPVYKSKFLHWAQSSLKVDSHPCKKWCEITLPGLSLRWDHTARSYAFEYPSLVPWLQIKQLSSQSCCYRPYRRTKFSVV